MREEDSDGLLCRSTRKRGIDGVAPELKTEFPNMRSGDGVGYAGDFEVEGAESEIGGEGGRGNKGAESGGGGVVFSW